MGLVGAGWLSRGGVMPVVGDWRVRAACRTEDPELFFPVGDGPATVAQVAQAKAVCARCPVVAQCLEFALVAIPEGVAGGLSGQERRELRAHRSGVPELAESVPAGVDEVVVASLVTGVPVLRASVVEVAQAVLELHLAGRSAWWIARRLGVDHRIVRRWLERYRAGEPLVRRVQSSGRVSA